MVIKKPIVISTKRKSESSDFEFSKDQVRMTGNNEIDSFRAHAWKVYQDTSIPTTRDEPWRRTDIRGLKLNSFQLLKENQKSSFSDIPKNLLEPIADGDHGGQIILYGHEYSQRLDEELSKKGVVFCDLLTAEKQHPELLAKAIGKIVKPEEGKFSALTGALAQNGVFLYVPRNVIIDTPLHSLIWGAELDFAQISHIVAYLEQGASATYVLEFASQTESKGQSLITNNIEIYVGPEANFRFVELQSLGKHVWNFTHERVQVDRNGMLDWIFGAIGGHLTKNFAELDLISKGAVGKMSGFYFTDDNQHLDYDSQQNHLAANTTSDLLFKGALVDESRSVWQGMIYVAPGADKTDGYQANRNLLLGKQARADSIPGLEILANDVRCTHGATVGKIDAEQIFYLMARGIDRQDAEKLIVEGFFDPIMQRIPFEGVKHRFQKAIADKMGSFIVSQ
ncbi:MAG: Fe-S cluster assembly protein SufD [Anaerolineaceae bacterium]|jgi:Fe-S cluster assembly protein SufD|nr:Fe-S cluster assembly protein SufD [Anaerolineaceae bacterium]